jgi:P27 family predicted phage terminase small subunit
MTATPTNGVKRGQGKRKPLMLATTASVSMPAPPKHLKAHGRAWWESIWRGGARWLDPASDHLIVELVCTTLDLIDEIEADLNANGRYYETKQGQQLPRPGVADCRALRAQVVSHLSLLAFSPSQRAEMGAGVEVNDALQQWRSRRGEQANGIVG